MKQKKFYSNELDKAIADIKEDFQNLLKVNKVVLEKAYAERIEQVKAQAPIQELKQEKKTASLPRVSIESLREELKQVEKTRDDIENEYRPLMENYLKRQKEKSSIDEERFRLDSEHNRLLTEVNQLTEAIEIARQYWFSVRFELETYRRLLDLQGEKTPLTNHETLANGKDEHIEKEEKPTVQIIKNNEIQRSISKTGIINSMNEQLIQRTNKSEGSILIYLFVTGVFDIDQVQVGFISINNAATNCVDQPLKGWTLVRTVNDTDVTVFQFPDNYVLKARTRVRVYSNKIDNSGTSNTVQGRIIAKAVPAWASLTPGENIKIELFSEDGTNRAQYLETWN